MTSQNLEPILAQMQQVIACDDALIVDCSELTFIDPFGLTVFASALESVQSAGRSIRFEFLGEKLRSYLQRMDFFKHFDIDGVNLGAQVRHSPKGKMCELTRIAREEDAEEALELLAWAVTGTLGGGEKPDDEPTVNAFELFVPIKYALSELVGNAVTHAKRQGYGHASVWVAAQYYPASGIVQIAVTDNGCGFLETLRFHKSLTEQTHVAAIAAALIPRVSCNRGVVPFGEPENQGVGLTTTARISKKAHGGILIFSGNGVHSDGAGSRQKRWQRRRSIGPHWQGVGVVIDLSREKLASIKIHELLPDDEPTLPNGDGPEINFV
ncbi:hypothetical protein MyNCGM152_10630 [Achromobacter xylosoxidans]